MANMIDKVVAITGAGSGIGRATAKLLASREAIVSIANRDQHGLEETLKALEGSKHILTVLDVRRRAEIEAWIDKTVKELGKLDGACNIAGVHTGKGMLISGETEENWDFVFDINAKGVFFCMRSELNHMGDGGSIVNAASVAGIRGLANSGICVASKHAVVGMTRTAARENGHRNIRVNAIAPGIIDTPMVKRFEADMGSRLSTEAQCLDRYAQPEEMMNVIAFMLSDEASFVTGSVWSADGGWHA